MSEKLQKQKKTTAKPDQADGLLPSKVFIYGLYCPFTDELRYVGKANNVEARFKSHLKDCHTRNTPVYHWIRSLLKKNAVPVIKVLEVADESTWVDAEIRLIAKFRASGRLLNLAEGGNEPYQTVEQRKKNALLMNALLMNRTEKEKALHQAKRRIASLYAEAKKDGKTSGDWSLAERMRLKMVELSESRPLLFRNWSDLRSVSHVQEVTA